MSPVLRFAPSPNGELHLGHAFSALLNADLAQRWDGRLLLRIEDIDTTRCTPEFEAGIYHDLEWLGVGWEKPVRRQSEHFGEYQTALARLIKADLVYPSFMSRSEIRVHIAEREAAEQTWPRDPDGAPLYPALDKQLSERERRERMASGKPYSWRLDMDAAIKLASAIPPPPTPPRKGEGGINTCSKSSSEDVAKSPSPLRGGVRGGGKSHEERGGSWVEAPFDFTKTNSIPATPERWGDVIVARSDIPTSYHLSVVLDDALQGITHIVRGVDLYEATSVHRLLQTLLNLPEPLYHHHRLILDKSGRKLSKSEKSTGLRVLREAGVTAEEVRHELLHQLP